MSPTLNTNTEKVKTATFHKRKT